MFNVKWGCIRPLLLGLAFAYGLGAAGTGHAADTLPLDGVWRFELDRADQGTGEHWFSKPLTESIKLPGILESQGYGDEISVRTPWVLTLYDKFWYLREDYRAYTNDGSVKVPFLCQPPRHYVGAAWYQRDVEIPKDWQNRRVTLFLERPHWQSTVWLDDHEIGSEISLCTPHEFDMGTVSPGHHQLTVRVDNRMILPYRPDAHSVSDSLDDAWNGIVGKIELRSTPSVWIENVHVFPHLETQSVTVKGILRNATGKTVTNLVDLNFIPAMADGGGRPALLQLVCTSGSTNFEAEVHSAYPVIPWSEFQPQLYELTVIKRAPGSVPDLTQWQRQSILFGFRDFHTDGNQFILNGQPVYFRGTHFGGDFPLTGYPPTDVESWRKIFKTCKEYGLNHVRFHSWCPPEAAFQAADELGFYLQIECGMWNEISPGSRMEDMLNDETTRIIRSFGNHPSLMMISAMNEAHGNWKPVLSQWVEHFRGADPRHLYTPDTGWSLIDSPDQPLNGGADYLAVGRIGPNTVRGDRGWFGGDYRDSIAGVNVPVIAHEVGQWCAYPDFAIINKFTGFMQPGNYEIFRDSLAAHGLLEKNRDFALASGRFQLACDKEEIEANLRTPGLSGFQLLDLHDYVGQGTALVGVLDTFWDSKGYVTAPEWRRFCGPTVPLARLARRTFTTDGELDAAMEVAHFGAESLSGAVPSWRIENMRGDIVASGQWPQQTIPVGKNFSLGNVAYKLAGLPAPAAYKLVASIKPPTGEPIENDWNFWVYPPPNSPAPPEGVLVTRSWDAAEANLARGGKVLYLPRNSDLDWTCPPLATTPVFWNRLMNPAWGRMLGLWCDAKHPALAEFPTESFCDWQWTELMRDTRAVNLDRLPRGLQPIVQAIDDWNRNWKLGLIFEGKAGPGRLLVCSVDLDGDLSRRPVAAQLRRSLLDYMAGPRFQPQTEVSPAEMRSFLFDTRIMKKLGAVATADGRGAANVIDGDPNTIWTAGGGRGTGRQPHQLTITFPAPTAMRGVVIMPRQNDRDHAGDVRGYVMETSDDGQDWHEAARGELVSAWRPQKIDFAGTIAAKKLRFTALTGFGTDTTVALAELAIVYAGPALPDTGSGPMEYQRSRSTSTDVDEGGATNRTR